MKIKMTQSIQGSLDGVTVIGLAAGQEYDTVDTARGKRLALAHIRKGVAVAVPAADAEPAPASPPSVEKKRAAAK